MTAPITPTVRFPVLAVAGLAMLSASVGLRAAAPELHDPPPDETSIFSHERVQQWVETSRAGHRYDIALSMPKGSAPFRGYPVIFVLDADTAFATVADAARNQEILYGPVAVVGIAPAGGTGGAAGGASRRRDMSLVNDLSNSRAARRSLARNNGADDFAAFLCGELEKSVESRVPVDPRRLALFGHSLGGLLALHILLTRPAAYDVIVAGSPSIWAGGELIWRELREFEQARQKRRGPPAVLMTVGALEDRLQPEEARTALAMHIVMTQAMVRDYAMIDNARSFASRLSNDRLEVTFRTFPDETHSSVIPAYLGAGVRLSMKRWYSTQSLKE